MVQVQLVREASATRRRERVTDRARRLLATPHLVRWAALVAVLLRLPGLTRPIRADEAGFTLVARAWHPEHTAMYGPYWVDRPPLLIEVFRVSDAIGGSLFIRVLGAVACGALVLLAAALARDVAGDRAARWVAVAAAAITGNIFVDAVAVKGELLALPFLVGSCLLSLRAVRSASSRSTLLLALGAGLLAATALGLKQNLVGGFVFGLVLVLAARITRQIDNRRLVRVLGGAAIGAALPVLATVGWAVAVDVPLHLLWYDVFGFRSDAAQQIARSESVEPLQRAAMLVASGVASGLLVIIAVWLAGLRGVWRRDRALTAATVTMLAVDGFGLVAGGSFWRDYLFPLVPGAVLCAAVLVVRADRTGVWMRGAIAFAAGSTVLAMVGWTAYNAAGLQEFDETDTGHALQAVAAPHDSLLVFGGRADLQLTSGMPSPYEHLWSLPMRTLDPDLTELQGVIAGPTAPTWIVEWVDFSSWNASAGASLERLVRSEYDEHGTGCGDRTVWLRKGLARPVIRPHCHR